MNEPESNESLARGGIAVYAIAVLAMLLGGGQLQQWDIHLGVILSQVLFILIPGLAFIYYLPERPKLWRRPSGKALLLVLITTPLIAFASNSLAGIVTELLNLNEFSEQYTDGIDALLRPEAPWRKIAGFVSICIIAPLCEETLFRGAILQSQKPHFGFLKAAILNGVLFSILHVNPMGFVSLAIIGFYFATLTRGGLVLAMIGHALLNFTSGAIPLFVVDQPLTDLESIELTILVPLFLVLASLAGFFWHKLWKTLPLEQP